MGVATTKISIKKCTRNNNPTITLIGLHLQPMSLPRTPKYLNDGSWLLYTLGLQLLES